MGGDDDPRTDGHGPTEIGYAQPATRIGGRSRRQWAIVAVGTAVFVALVVVKPWGQPATAPASDVPLAVAPVTSTPTLPARVTTSPPSGPVTADPPWPVGPAGGALIHAPDPRDPSTTAVMAAYAGSWGVAALGNAPSFVLVKPWAEWTAVSPALSSEIPRRILTWPGTGICTSTPVVVDGPSVVAITTPAAVTIDRPIEGWWADAGHIGSLDGSIRELSASGPPGVAYLERLDGSPWPSGRYEFHVSSRGQIVALVVCLAPTG